MNEPSGHYAKRNKSVPKGQLVLYEVSKIVEAESRMVIAGAGVGKGGRNGELFNGHKVSVMQDEYSIVLWSTILHCVLKNLRG